MDSDRHQAAVSSRNEWFKLNCDGGLAGLSLVVIPFYFVVFWGGGGKARATVPAAEPMALPRAPGPAPGHEGSPQQREFAAPPPQGTAPPSTTARGACPIL